MMPILRSELNEEERRRAEVKAANVNEFIEEVNRRAEQKMLITGKLEGSHYAAMQELQKEWNNKARGF